jgi:FlaG/FlaF family flagellin (archaellin)
LEKNNRIKLKNFIQPFNNKGVSEIIGTMLLLLIAISLFSVLYSMVFLFQPLEKPTDAEVVFSIADTNITLLHMGGESIDADSFVSITINDSIVRKKITEFSDWDTNGDMMFGVGERIQYSQTDENLDDKQVFIQLIDAESNYLLMNAISEKEKKIYSEIPVISSPFPVNESTAVILNESLGITVFDLNEELLSISWYILQDESWDLVHSSLGYNGRYYVSSTNFSLYETIYYWKVIVSDDEQIIESPIYHFTTGSEITNSPPELSYIAPIDNEVDLELETSLNWTATDVDRDNITYDVYFGDSVPPPLVIKNQTEITYELPLLEYETTYYWLIIAWDENNASTIGPIWEFTTALYIPVETIEFYDTFIFNPYNVWNGKWVEDYQNDWVPSYQRSTEGLFSAEVDGFAYDATLTLLNSIDLDGKISATLTFDWFIEKGFDGGEYVALDIYDGTWNYNILRLDGNIDVEDEWHSESIDLSSYLVSNFRIRFRANTDNQNEDANIDDVMIISYS